MFPQFETTGLAAQRRTYLRAGVVWLGCLACLAGTPPEGGENERGARDAGDDVEGSAPSMPLRHAAEHGSSEAGADVADAVDDAGSGRGAPLPGDVERDGAGEEGVGAEQE